MAVHSIALLDHIEANLKRDPVTGCEEWQLSKRAGGYGQVRRKGRTYKVHRKRYEMANGVVLPPSVVIRHRCDNPACAALEHLVEGSQSDNMDDMWSRGRGGHSTYLRGEQHHQAKLTQQVAAEIRTSPLSNRKAAVAFGVGVTTIKDIRGGRRWT